MVEQLCKSLSGMNLCVGGTATKINAVRNLLNRPAFADKVKYLHKEGVLEWLYNEPTFIKGLTQESEKAWGTSIIGYKTGQWTTELGENILNDILTISGKNPHKIKTHQRAANKKRLDPDREADDGLYECKARNYKTTGTAGEKILGCPIKYCEVPRLYGKPLFIVCLGFQEVEAENDFQLFEPRSAELRMQVAFWKDMFNISFLKATDMLDKCVTVMAEAENTPAVHPPVSQDGQHESHDVPKTFDTQENR